MKSFLNIEKVSKKVETKTRKDGSTYQISCYDELGIADMFAQWLIEISSGRQNKYVVCQDWNVTRQKDFDDRGINDLSSDAQAWVFTMVYLAAATKANAMVPSRDEDENTLAKDYNIPKGKNITTLINYSHRIGLSTLLAEKDKFALETNAIFKVDMDKILSPSGCDAFIAEHKASGDGIETTSYSNAAVAVLGEVEGFYTEKDLSVFEATLSDSLKVSKEVSQILSITGTSFRGLGREQATDSNEVLIRWLAKPVKE